MSEQKEGLSRCTTNQSPTEGQSGQQLLARLATEMGKGYLPLERPITPILAEVAGTLTKLTKPGEIIEPKGLVALVHCHQSKDEVEVFSPIAGEVVGVNFKVGDTVRVGDVIATTCPPLVKEALPPNEPHHCC
jgi:hypothetical protein